MNEVSRRHAPTGRPRRRAVRDETRGLPHLYASRKRRPLPDLYIADKAEVRRGGRFRWLFSTCLAAAVGTVAIAAVILGSMDRAEKSADQIARAIRAPVPAAPTRASDGLRWSTPKTDRLHATSGAISTKYVVQESVKQPRDNREYIYNKFYARITVRLAAVRANGGVNIPPFNPFLLYGNPDSPDAGRHGQAGLNEVFVKVVELLGSILPMEDGQEMDHQEVADLIDRTTAGEAPIRPSFVPEGADLAPRRSGSRLQNAPEPLAPHTTVLEKSAIEADDVIEDSEGQRVRMKLSRGETLAALLVRMGMDAWQAREMSEKARPILPEIPTSYEIELTLVPSLTNSAKLEPTRFAVFAEDGMHKLTVGRNAGGEFVASAVAVEPAPSKVTTEGPERSTATSLYTSLYHGALSQGVPQEVITSILKVHAYETDFRRRARGSDTVDLFFDLRDEGKAADNPPSELLSTAITITGDTQRYYRFRTPDGIVDFYDESGNNSRKFLMRRPIRDDDVRFVSGYGLRRHPLLGGMRMHTGVDWAGPLGTAILAAGNGVIEEIKFNSSNGNYIRIRHANGYQTSYSHMLSRFPPDIREGAKVRQGQTIGYLGNTGLSTGPHLHFEILVGNRFVDPMSIQVPKERKLAGKQLQDFQRERARIEDLMRRPPVRVAQLDGR